MLDISIKLNQGLVYTQVSSHKINMNYTIPNIIHISRSYEVSSYPYTDSIKVTIPQKNREIVYIKS